MPLPLLLAPAAIAGVKTLYTALNKPKLREPKFMIEALDKQIANNSADIVNKTLMNVGTSAAKSAGARLYQQQERGIGQMAERGQLSEGQEAQALLEAGSNVQGVVGEQSQNLLMPQIDRNLQMKQQNDQSRLAIAQMKDEARQRLRAEKQQWQNELAGGIIDTVTSTFSGIMQNIQDKKITDMVGGMLNGRNLPDLSDSELNGLMTSLYLAKLGIMPNQATPTPTAYNTLLNKGKTPTVRDEVRTQLDGLKQAGDAAEGLLIQVRKAANTSPALTPPAEAATPAATQTGTGKSYAEWQNLVNGGDMSAATINMRNIESFKERGFWLDARGQRVTTPPTGYTEAYGGQSPVAQNPSPAAPLQAQGEEDEQPISVNPDYTPPTDTLYRPPTLEASAERLNTNIGKVYRTTAAPTGYTEAYGGQSPVAQNPSPAAPLQAQGEADTQHEPWTITVNNLNTGVTKRLNIPERFFTIVYTPEGLHVSTTHDPSQAYEEIKRLQRNGLIEDLDLFDIEYPEHGVVPTLVYSFTRRGEQVLRDRNEWRY